jgi:predicted SAM-dependent methyltransferase
VAVRQLGLSMASAIGTATRTLLSGRTRRSLRFDMLRLRARASNQWKQIEPPSTRLHFGCGRRKVPGWLNVDVGGSDIDLDLCAGSLPFPDEAFEVAVAQQFIEHLELDSQLSPLLDELHRVIRPGGMIWVSCPDMERICRSYLADGGAALLRDRQARWPEFDLGGKPTQQMMNIVFHQAGEHVNLFDFNLLAWLLDRHGFIDCARVAEADFRKAFPEFPVRGDDEFTLFVRASRAPRRPQ